MGFVQVENIKAIFFSLAKSAVKCMEQDLNTNEILTL